MNELFKLIRQHYEKNEASASLVSKVTTILDSLPDGCVDSSQLAGLDQFHVMGLAATEQLAQIAGIERGAAILDAGSGLGGPSRYLAGTYGCRVIGVDFSPSFVAVAQLLTQRTGLSALVSYQIGVVLVPFIKSAAGLFLVLTIWGISQAALFTVSHTRVMNAAESTPALGASLNISGANLGIALGAIVGGRMIDLFGLASVSAAAAAIVAVAIGAATFLMVTESPKTQTCEECGSTTE